MPIELEFVTEVSRCVVATVGVGVGVGGGGEGRKKSAQRHYIRDPQRCQCQVPNPQSSTKSSDEPGLFVLDRPSPTSVVYPMVPK